MDASLVKSSAVDVSRAREEQLARFGAGGVGCYRGGYSEADNSAERAFGAGVIGKRLRIPLSDVLSRFGGSNG